MKTFPFLIALAFTPVMASPAQAAPCDTDYVVEEFDAIHRIGRELLASMLSPTNSDPDRDTLRFAQLLAAHTFATSLCDDETVLRKELPLIFGRINDLHPVTERHAPALFLRLALGSDVLDPSCRYVHKEACRELD